MQRIKISDVKIKDNVRKDYGDLTELTASIKSHGIRVPIELNKDNELVDGYRRCKAAIKAGLTKIPFYRSEDNLDRTTAQLIAGIFSKNLNPIEEGRAFKELIKVTEVLDLKDPVKELSKRISKSKLYVERRLKLIELPQEVKDALIKSKIQLGHALLLSRLPKSNSAKYLRDIVRNKLSVERAKEELEWGEFSIRLFDACFNKNA